MDTYWNELLEARIARLLQNGEPLVLATIIARSGSTPRHAGTRALQTRKGFEGTVGGGLLEAQTMDAAQKALASGHSSRASFDLAGTLADSDMICGGGMEVLCEVLTPEQAPMFALAADLLDRGGSRAYWTVTIEGPRIHRQLHVEQLPPTATSPLPANVCAGVDMPLALYDGHRERPCLFRQCAPAGQENADCYVEPLNAPPVLLLVGGGHVSLCVAQLAHDCDFVVDVVDDREEFANNTRFPMARRCLVLPRFENLAEACAIGPRHFVAIMTRGHAYDREALAQALPAQPRYLGMIGSRTKREQVYAHLRAQGVTDEALARVCCPIGLGIEAETPQQIAVSVVSELLAERKGTLAALRTATHSS